MHPPDIRPATPLRVGTDVTRPNYDDASGLQSDVSGNGRGALRTGLSRVDGIVQPADGADAGAAPIPCGRQYAPGAGSADGSPVGTAGGGTRLGGLGFDAAVAPGGYVWWYVDAISDDGQHALTIIAFIGSVFSPYYAAARRLGWNDPENFCAVNVALYEPRRKFWSLTERTRRDLRRDHETLAIGPSQLRCDGRTLVIDINELTVPVPRRIRGTVVLTPTVTNGASMTLDDAGRHRWRPIAPQARVSVELDQPGIRWQGTAYLDTNAGDEPLEKAFKAWDWSRAHTSDGTTITYDVTRRDGSKRSVGRIFDTRGLMRDAELPASQALPATHWRVARATRCDPGHAPHVVRTLEDTPFYSRSLVETHISGRMLRAIHESLSLDRVANPIVRCMLPFRMPRKSFRNSEAVRRA